MQKCCNFLISYMVEVIGFMVTNEIIHLVTSCILWYIIITNRYIGNAKTTKMLIWPAGMAGCRRLRRRALRGARATFTMLWPRRWTHLGVNKYFIWNGNIFYYIVIYDARFIYNFAFTLVIFVLGILDHSYVN